MSPLKVDLHKRYKDSFSSPFKYDVITTGSLEAQGSKIYFGTDGGKLVSYDIKRNSVDWKFKTGTSLEGTALAYQDKIFFGNSEGYFFCVDRKTAEKSWEYKAQGEVFSKPAVNPDGMVYFASLDGVVTALDMKSGEWQWHYKRPLNQKISVKGVSSPLLVGSEAVVVGFQDGFVVGLNPNDGSLLWEKRISTKGRFLDVDADPVLYKGKIIIPSYEDGLYAIDTDGGIVWKFEKGGAGSKVLVFQDSLYFVSNSGELFNIDPENGKEIWVGKFEKASPTNPVIMGDKIIFGTYPGSIYVFSAKTGKQLWKYIVSSNILGNITLFEDRLYFTTSRGDIFSLSVR